MNGENGSLNQNSALGVSLIGGVVVTMENNQNIRLLVENFYDQQKTRQESANRIRTIVRNTLEKEDFREVETKKTKDERAYGKEWNDKEVLKKIAAAEKQDQITEAEVKYLYNLMATKKKLKSFENDYHKEIIKQVKEEPIYEEYLLKIRGVAELTAANLISYLGYCENFDTISKLWRYCGLAVIDGNAERRKKGEKIHYNPKLKTLMYKISDCFIKQGDKYRQLYDDIKGDYQTRFPEPIENPTYKETKKGFKQKYTKMHIDLMARRKLIKIFLANYWIRARKMKDLPIREPYILEHGEHSTLIKPFTDK